MGGGMGGRTTTVANPPCETIFVANLSPNTTEEELIEARPPPSLSPLACVRVHVRRFHACAYCSRG
jgi:hypothetical protein